MKNITFFACENYYPFGMVMPNRSYSAGTYRFGFNGKENDNEVKGSANQQDYGMRIYDGRIGRFLSIDPLTSKYPFYSPYQFAGNSPIYYIDLDGGERDIKDASPPPTPALKIYTFNKNEKGKQDYVNMVFNYIKGSFGTDCYSCYDQPIKNTISNYVFQSPDGTWNLADPNSDLATNLGASQKETNRKFDELKSEIREKGKEKLIDTGKGLVTKQAEKVIAKKLAKTSSKFVTTVGKSTLFVISDPVVGTIENVIDPLAGGATESEVISSTIQALSNIFTPKEAKPKQEDAVVSSKSPYGVLKTTPVINEKDNTNTAPTSNPVNNE